MSRFEAVADRLAESVAMAVPALHAIGEERASRPRAPGKWSPKQVLGHLIDSAANNHQRFVRGQEGRDVHLPPYTQDHWVAVQDYGARPWTSLIELWSAYNRHLAHVVRRIPESARDNACTIGPNAPVTLAFLATDYVDHLWHHLAQIGIAPGEQAPPPTAGQAQAERP